MNSYLNALAVDVSGNLSAGGKSTTAGGVSANNIAKWNGTSSTDQNPLHNYTKVETYTVKLTVKGLGGTNTATKTGYIKILKQAVICALFSRFFRRGLKELLVPSGPLQ